MPAHPLASRYDEVKNLFSVNPLSTEITDKFEEINNLCQSEINTLTKNPIISRSTAIGKNYIVFSNVTGKYSRPVNIDLYNAGRTTNSSGVHIISEFWNNVRSHSIQSQNAHDITAALYAICMNYCCCADLVTGVKSNSGDYFEKLVGHLYSMHLNVAPTNQMNAVELDGESISLPTDFIFDLGMGKPKFHIPAKTSTRERVVEVWAQQRVLDGAFGVGRFLCLLTCIGETNFYSKDMSVALTCVPNQWINYQLFISQIKRAYYLDIPEKYNELNHRFPRIHVKEFGEFFHESDNLIK
ncbi:MAG: hypothetical protein HDQ95_11800 [Roseburia sp.]|nr:hypothetical protein [Roseburia sp.]